ncbi:MAG TPA: family 1 glycosylhydrolase [Acidimicrobiales bacterium]|nr:family 1 glycosylhydrolase [Acidimicrobiales bacterium]
MTARSFPKAFLWGTATASYQVEGEVEGRGRSIWDTFSHQPGNTRNGDNGDVACQHYSRLEEDLDLVSELGVNAYRFSIAWPRAQPDGKGPANQAGLDFYRRMVDGLRARGALPVGTLYHWDLPQALEDEGGWAERVTAERYGDYVAMVASALGDDVGAWVTLNEPWCSSWLGYGTGLHAPGRREPAAALRAAHHLLLAHGRGVEALRALTKSPVGISLCLVPAMPASQHELDVAAADWVDGNQNRAFLWPLFKSSYPEDVSRLFGVPGQALDFVEPGDMAQISRPIDFLGVNYYQSIVWADLERVARAQHDGYFVPASLPSRKGEGLPTPVRVLRPGLDRTAMGWEIDPPGLTATLVRVRDDFTHLPLYVTENGVALNDYRGPDGAVHDPGRVEYLAAHIDAVAEAIDQGVDVRGYFTWSLMDNFEWQEGYAMRFGLAWVDYPTGERVRKDSFHWYKKVAATNALA